MKRYLKPFSLLVVLGFVVTTTQCGEDALSSRNALAKLTPSERGLVQSGNVFGFDLLRHVAIAQPDQNVFLSPLSASMALGMARNGANGTTETAMNETLGLSDLSSESANAAYRRVINLLLGLDSKVEMKLANSIWHRQEWAFEPAFLTTNQTYFNATIQGMNFDNPASKETINRWVNTQTNGRIPVIIDEIPAEAVMYLINAIYFKGIWTYRFDKSQTRQEPFYRSESHSVSVPMMRQSATLAFLQTDELQVVDLPYGAGAFRMTVLLPAPGVSVGDFVATITPERWEQWIGALRETPTDVFLPRFTFSYERLLNPDLTAMGMGVAFSPDEANFTRMYAPGGLYISGVKQKAFIEVNEEGTEAAAATSVEIGTTSIGVTRQIRVDRPFLFAIREKTSGTVLFMGQVVNPAGE